MPDSHILRFISSFSNLQVCSNYTRAHCPLHKDHNKSMVVYNGSNRAKCFSCCFYGDVIDLCKAKYNVDFKTAVKILNEANHIQTTNDTTNTPQQAPKSITIFNIQISQSLSNFCDKCCDLMLNTPNRGLNYAISRGLSRDFIKRFSIGFCAKSVLYGSLNTNQIEFLGLKNMIWRMIIPIYNSEMMPISVCGRYCGEPSSHKYLYKNNLMFAKSQTVFGIQYIKRYCIITEGILDCLSLVFHGYEACSIMGCSISRVQANTILDAAQIIFIMMDSDNAGTNASQSVFRTLTTLKGDRGVRIHNISLSQLTIYKDPNEAITRDKESFFTALDAIIAKCV